MNFKKVIPDDYYQTKIIKDFESYDINLVHYNTPLYTRNPPKNGKLTLNHIELIEYFIRLIKPKNFLELGVQFGECTIKIIDLIPDKYYGVDIEINENIEYLIQNKSKFEFHHLSTNQFFENLNGKNLNLDMAFIDACHSHAASYTDFLNVKDHMNDDGIIFFHDTYPASIEWTDAGLCNDCYKTPEYIRKNHSDEFEIITFPINPGISIARKCKKQLKWL